MNVKLKPLAGRWTDLEICRLSQCHPTDFVGQMGKNSWQQRARPTWAHQSILVYKVGQSNMVFECERKFNTPRINNKKYEWL